MVMEDMSKRTDSKVSNTVYEAGIVSDKDIHEGLLSFSKGTDFSKLRCGLLDTLEYLKQCGEFNSQTSFSELLLLPELEYLNPIYKALIEMEKENLLDKGLLEKRVLNVFRMTGTEEENNSVGILQDRVCKREASMTVVISLLEKASLWAYSHRK